MNAFDKRFLSTGNSFVVHEFSSINAILTNYLYAKAKINRLRNNTYITINTHLLLETVYIGLYDLIKVFETLSAHIQFG